MGSALRLSTLDGALTAPKVALATGAFPSRLRRVRPYLVPVYDYVLMTEPLTAPLSLARLGWANRQGVGDRREPVSTTTG